MTEPDIVPEVVKNPINIKVLLAIIAITVAIYFSMQIIDEDTINLILFPISIIFTSAAVIAALFVSKQHWGTVFGKSYLILGIGYFFYTVAEITFYVLDFLGYDNQLILKLSNTLQLMPSKQIPDNYHSSFRI